MIFNKVIYSNEISINLLDLFCAAFVEVTITNIAEEHYLNLNFNIGILCFSKNSFKLSVPKSVRRQNRYFF